AGEPDDQIEDLAADLFERGAAFEDAAGVHIHVVLHASIGVGIRADLDHGRNRGANDRAAPGREQDQVSTAGDQLDDFRIVRDIREAEARLAVRYDVEQVQSAARRYVARLEQAADRRGSRLRVRAHRLLFLRRQAAFGIAGGEAALAHDAVILRRLRHARLDLRTELGRDRTLRHHALAADELARFFEDAGRVRFHERIETAAHGGIGGQTAGAVGAAAYGAHDQLVERHRDQRCGAYRLAHALHDALAGCERLHRAAFLLDDEPLERADALAAGSRGGVARVTL